MAIARCVMHGKPKGAGVKAPGYGQQPFHPISHPQSGVVCGRQGCETPGLIWLKLPEEKLYQQGQRVFRIHTHTAKVRVQ
jgi:hypothetical protein